MVFYPFNPKFCRKVTNFGIFFHPFVSPLLSFRFSTQSPSPLPSIAVPPLPLSPITPPPFSFPFPTPLSLSAHSPQSFWPHSQSRQLLPLVGKVVSTNQNDFSHQWQKSIRPAERRYLKISNITTVKTKYWPKPTKNHHHPHLPSP